MIPVTSFAGKTVAVFADETRPFLQGARLTAWELVKDGIDTTVITESMAGPLMRRYSKALEYDYSPSLRAELLADAARRHGPDINAAIAALANAANSEPLLAQALARAEQES